MRSGENALGILDLLQPLIFRLATFSGLRPGEIFAIRLAKTPGTTRLLSISEYTKANSILRRAAMGRTQHVSSDSRPRPPQKLSFCRTGKRMLICFHRKLSLTPLRPNNLWKREIQPRLEGCRPWLGQLPTRKPIRVMRLLHAPWPVQLHA